MKFTYLIVISLVFLLASFTVASPPAGAGAHAVLASYSSHNHKHHHHRRHHKHHIVIKL